MKKVTYGDVEAHLKRRTAQYTNIFDDDAARAFRHGWLISAVVELLNDPESAELTQLKNEIPPWCPPVENVVLPERLTATQVSQRQMEKQLTRAEQVAQGCQCAPFEICEICRLK